MKLAIMINRKLSLQMPWTDGSTVTFSAVVYKQDADTVTVKIPQRIRAMRFTSYPEYGYKFPIALAKKAITKKYKS